ncbi:MAG: cyclic nucleotide-binding domain-containing protein [Deltaproteobacteria bacterium]|nr:cyclic nucleotide-binding domain-containing protein [Deltaproteobacteria bacterium]
MERDPKLLIAQDRAESLMDEGAYPEALSLYLWLVDNEPEDFRHRMRIAEILLRLGEKGKSLDVLTQVATQSVLCGRVMRTVSACKLGLGLFPEEHKTFELLLTRLHRRAVLLDRPPVSPPKDDGDATDAETGAGEAPVAGISSPPSPPSSSEGLSELINKAYEAANHYASVAEGVGDNGELELAAMPFFSDLAAGDFVAVVKGMNLLDIDRDTKIIKQGEDGNSFFLLVRGSVIVEKELEDGPPVELAKLGDGSLFGEMALLSRSPRIATVRSLTRCELFEVPRIVLDDLVEERPRVASSLVEFTKKRLLANLLTTSPLFSRFSREDRKSIIKLFDKVLVDEGEIVVEEGTEPGALYLVSSGEVAVTRAEEGKEKIRLATLGPGEVFGEISLLKNQPANASVTAETRSVLLRLDRERFFNMAMQYPPILEYLENLSEERLAATEEILSDDWVYGADDLIMV